MPSHLPHEVRRLLDPVRLLVLDVDGVLTDGSLWYGPGGEEFKRFHVRDGLAVRLLVDAGLAVAIISGRTSEAVAVRCRDLGVDAALVIQGSRDKSADLDRLESILGLSDGQVAAIGDDLPDLPLLARAGFTACPADAAPEVAAACDHVCGAEGGHGAVREVAELLLKAQGRWVSATGRWLVAAPRSAAE